LVAAIVGGSVSLVALHAPVFIGGKLGFLLGGWVIALIYGGPGFAPFFVLYLILWYNPPRKKVQDKQPTTSGAPATDAHEKSAKVPSWAETAAVVDRQTWWMPGWMGFFAIFSAIRQERWERAAFERRERIARGADGTVQAAEKTDTTTTKVRCPHCQHAQTVPVSQETFACEQCKAQCCLRWCARI
jgi:hypothetical protein